MPDPAEAARLAAALRRAGTEQAEAVANAEPAFGSAAAADAHAEMSTALAAELRVCVSVLEDL